MKRRLLCALLLLPLMAASGCARIEVPAVTSRHPANPEAQPAALSGLSGTLDIDEDNLPAPPPQMQPESNMHPERSHGAGSSAREKGDQEK